MQWIQPDWPAPVEVCAISTTRQGGVSEAPFAGLNLGSHVGDQLPHVLQNRQILQHTLGLSQPPVWLEQVHGTQVVQADACQGAMPPQADGAFTRQANVVCAVMTADCLPVLLCDRAGTVVAAVHAGWRGLLDGVLEQAVAKMAVPANTLLAWLGPAISQQAFEVGDEVRTQFVAQDPKAADAFIAASSRADMPCLETGPKWYADLPALARQRLASVGVKAVYGGQTCTYATPAQFFSYRRDGQTGRMASLIWLTSRDSDPSLPTS